METKKLNESIISIRVKLQETKLKKSGKNKFAGFDYFELADFLPTLNKLMLEEGVNDIFSIVDNIATLKLVKGDESNIYEMPFVLFETPLTLKKDKNGSYMKDENGNYMQTPSMQDIQYLGALNTYYKRYLYLNAFGITDGDIIDSIDNSNITEKQEKDYRQELIIYCNENDIEMHDIAVNYKLNSKSKNEDFKNALEDLKNKKGV